LRLIGQENQKTTNRTIPRKVQRHWLAVYPSYGGDEPLREND
jgi:hypothetical protein